MAEREMDPVEEAQLEHWLSEWDRRREQRFRELVFAAVPDVEAGDSEFVRLAKLAAGVPVDIYAESVRRLVTEILDAESPPAQASVSDSREVPKAPAAGFPNWVATGSRDGFGIPQAAGSRKPADQVPDASGNPYAPGSRDAGGQVPDAGGVPDGAGVTDAAAGVPDVDDWLRDAMRSAPPGPDPGPGFPSSAGHARLVDGPSRAEMAAWAASPPRPSVELDEEGRLVLPEELVGQREKKAQQAYWEKQQLFRRLRRAGLEVPLE
jgi:hypothetical protein